MHLLEGELEVTIGDKKFSLASGESYFAPRNVPHRIRNQTPARSLSMTTPGFTRLRKLNWTKSERRDAVHLLARPGGRVSPNYA
jgi:hypothetical protein